MIYLFLSGVDFSKEIERSSDLGVAFGVSSSEFSVSEKVNLAFLVVAGIIF